MFLRRKTNIYFDKSIHTERHHILKTPIKKRDIPILKNPSKIRIALKIEIALDIPISASKGRFR